MKIIGLIGGLTWRSTIEYYRLINQTVEQKLGAPHSARINLHSFDRAEFLSLMEKGEEYAEEAILNAFQRLKSSGSEVIAFCANGIHRFARQLEVQEDIEIVHIANSVAIELRQLNLKKVGLLGVKKTMESDFYQKHLQVMGVEQIIPSSDEMNEVHRIIYEELAHGIIRQESKEIYRSIMRSLESRGAEAFILGCTEIPHLFGKEDFHLPLIDTVSVHCRHIVQKSICGKVGG